MKAVLFDLDGTLFDRESAVRELFADQHRRFGSDLATIPEDAYVRRVLEVDAHGYGDKRSGFRRLAAELGLQERLAEGLFTDFRARYHSFCRPFPEVGQVLRELRRRGLKLGLITNGPIAVQDPVVDRLGIRPLFDAILISEREGIRKPAREIFERAVRAIGIAPQEAWYVGDHPEVDVAAAVAAGLAAVWRRTAHWPEPTAPHLAIDSLEDLLMAEDLRSGRGSPARSTG